MPVHRTVEVWGKSYTVNTHQKYKSVNTHQKYKSVWIAVGEYMGEMLDAKDRSEATAIKRWKEKAHAKGS